MASFTYQNITNPSLTNVGIAGDTIRVVVTTSEKVRQTNPVPTIGFIYNSLTATQGDTVLALNLAEANTDSITWIFDVILADSVFNDGIMNFNFNGNDLAENPLESFQSNQIFAVDNLPPAYYETGEVQIVGSIQSKDGLLETQLLLFAQFLLKILISIQLWSMVRSKFNFIIKVGDKVGKPLE